MRTVLMSAMLILSASQLHAQVQWRADLKNAREEASASGKNMLLHFYSDTCQFCAKLENGAYQDPQIVQAIHARYVPVKINGTKFPTLVQKFGVERYPTDVIVTADGTIISHQISPQEPSRYFAMLSGQSSSTANIAQSAVQNSVQSPNNGMQGQPFGGVNANFVSQRTGEVNSLSPPVNMNAAAPGFASNANFSGATQSAPATAPQPTEPLVDGYCLVSLSEAEQWVPGSPSFGVIHLGELYYFADAAAQAKFLAAPNQYAPVMNGLDVVKFFDEHRIVRGSREWGFVEPTSNRMFFFSSAESMSRYESDYLRYTNKAIELTERAAFEANGRR